MAMARDKGYNAFSTRAGFDALDGGNNATLPFLGLYTPGHMSYEVSITVYNYELWFSGYSACRLIVEAFFLPWHRLTETRHSSPPSPR